MSPCSPISLADVFKGKLKSQHVMTMACKSKKPSKFKIVAPRVHIPAQDVFSRVMDWWAGTAPDQPASRDPESRNPECEEFLRQRESPDTRVLQSLSQAPGIPT